MQIQFVTVAVFNPAHSSGQKRYPPGFSNFGIFFLILIFRVCEIGLKIDIFDLKQSIRFVYSYPNPILLGRVAIYDFWII